MADYWKSQDRKFCDFCKCWITDNKPSVDFHNNGKRHKANVEKRLNEIGKKSDTDRKAQNVLNEEMRKINEAAMKSYANDIAGSKKFAKAIDPIALPHYEEEGASVSSVKSTATTEVIQSLWCEAVTDDGDTYYWNVKTNESVWDKPKEGFMTLVEYNKLNRVAVDKQEEDRQRDAKYLVENADEIVSKYKREQLKKYQKITQEPKSSETSTEKNYATEYDNNYRVLGKWESVEIAAKEEKPVDLELPKQNHVYHAVASVQSDEPIVKKFKEKIIDSLDSEEAPSVFKKRKISSRSIRRTNNDE